MSNLDLLLVISAPNEASPRVIRKPLPRAFR
jgi:hypothetical protein